MMIVINNQLTLEFEFETQSLKNTFVTKDQGTRTISHQQQLASRSIISSEEREAQSQKAGST